MILFLEVLVTSRFDCSWWKIPITGYHNTNTVRYSHGKMVDIWCSFNEWNWKIKPKTSFPFWVERDGYGENNLTGMLIHSWRLQDTMFLVLQALEIGKIFSHYIRSHENSCFFYILKTTTNRINSYCAISIAVMVCDWLIGRLFLKDYKKSMNFFQWLSKYNRKIFTQSLMPCKTRTL